jgi:catechol 2,3-dioxygenase-like lactoylglutathione lyase family enzyme
LTAGARGELAPRARPGTRRAPVHSQRAALPDSPRVSTLTPPRTLGVYETALYASDVAATAAFYEQLLGLQPLPGLGSLGAAFRLPDGGMLLIFDPELSTTPGRQIPSHGAIGQGHVAFSVGPGGLEAFAGELRRREVTIESEVEWPEGGRSLYIRDPAGNSVELIEGEAWPERG